MALGMRSILDIARYPIQLGVIKMPREQYRVACGLNPSSLKQPSPRHVRYAYENETEPTDAMKLGTAVHALCWEPHRFEQDIAVWPNIRRGKEWAAFKEANDGKLILTTELYRRAVDISSALVADPLVGQLAFSGIAETAVFTEELGLQCRGLLDWVNTDLGILCDLKVVNNVQARLFGSAVIRYGWDVSVACYHRWFQRESGKEIAAVKFIAVESKPPYDVVVFDVDHSVLEAGWTKAEKSISEVKHAIVTGVWPGIAGHESLPLYVPNWAMEEPELTGMEIA